MNKILVLSIVVFVFTAGSVFADIFAEGTANEFTIDFVPISGDNGDLGSWNTRNGYTFSGVNHGDYRMGTYEITNAQWTSFVNVLGTQGIPVTGSPTSAYDEGPHFTGGNMPTNNVSWYEAAQFVNWLNTSMSHSPAYKFTGTQGTGDYTFVPWEVGDTGYNASNPYRNSNAYYFLPTEDERVKAAYWNGTNLQRYATVGDVTPTQAGWNFYDGGYVTFGPWNVGYGTEELNGTFDMMGNLREWTESPFYSGEYLPGSHRSVLGGLYASFYYSLGVTSWAHDIPGTESSGVGFRVASVSELPPIPVSIDIKPKNCPNPLNTNSKGVLSVATLGTEVFDVNEIDIASLNILGVRPIRSSIEDVATPLGEETLPEDCLCTTDGPDGYLDLTLKFNTQDIVEAIGEVEDGDYVVLTLTGILTDGTLIEGTDCVVILKKKKQ